MSRMSDCDGMYSVEADPFAELEASSDGSSLDDIEAELYSKIYYSSGCNDDLASAATLVTSHHTAVTADSSSCAVSCGDGATHESVKLGLDPGANPCLLSREEPAACSQSDQVSQKNVLPDEDVTDDPGEYVLLSSDDDGGDQFALRRGTVSANSTLVIDSDDSDVYVVSDACEFEFNTLSQEPECSATIGSLDEVLASLPGHGWHIINADKHPNLYRSRYYNVQCRNCTDKGHTANECSKPKKVQSCILCGTRGHTSWTCKQQLCVNCCQFGHTYSACRSTHRKLLFCHRCRRRGHVEETCAELWRQFHWAARPEAFHGGSCKPPSHPKVNRLRYCANCALRGHFAFECKAERSNPFRPVLSVFVSEYGSPKSGGKPTLKADCKPYRDGRVSHSATKPKPSYSQAPADLGRSSSCGPPREYDFSRQRPTSVGASPVLASSATGRPLQAPSTDSRKQKRHLRIELWEAKRAQKFGELSERSFANGSVAWQQMQQNWPREWQHEPEQQEQERKRKQQRQQDLKQERKQQHQERLELKREQKLQRKLKHQELLKEQQRRKQQRKLQQQQQQLEEEDQQPKQQGKQQVSAIVRPAAAEEAGGTPAKRPRVSGGFGGEADSGSVGRKRAAHSPRTAAASNAAAAAAALDSAGGQGRGGSAKAAGNGLAESSERKLRQQHAIVQQQQRRRWERQLTNGEKSLKRRSKAVGKRWQLPGAASASDAGAATPPSLSVKKKAPYVTVTDGDITSHHFRSPGKLVVRFSY